MLPPSTASHRAPTFVWQSPDQQVAIEMEMDFVDQLAAEVIRGYGLVPRRGAEVGGLLLGEVLSRTPLRVRLREFVPAVTEYLYGPSLIFSPKDKLGFLDLLQRWRTQPDRQTEIVGFYRSHTREGFGWNVEDEALFHEAFQEPFHVFLLIKPYATRVPEAAFSFWRDGKLSKIASEALLPFRRKELSSGPLPRSVGDSASATAAPPSHKPEPSPDGASGMPTKRPLEDSPTMILPIRELMAHAASSASTGSAESSSLNGAAEPDAWHRVRPSSPALEQETMPRQLRSRWAGVAGVAFLALSCGVVLGYRAAQQTQPRTTKEADYSLGLVVKPQSEGVQVNWNSRAPAVLAASSGVLTIRDGGIPRRVDLSRADLQTGHVIYRHGSPQLSFRLEVAPAEQVTVSEAVDVQVPARPLLP